MKRLTLALLMSCIAPAALQAAEPTVIANVGFNGSEAARYDDRRDEYLVSNRGLAAGPDSFISRVSPDGTVTELKWIEHGRNGVTLLDALGIFVHGDMVYVADTTAVRMFDRTSGAPRGSVDVPGAVRLNDLAVAPDGTVYVSDSGSDDAPGAIFRITKAGKVSPFVARDPALERVNGVAVMPDGSIVHGGRGVNLVFRSAKGNILREVTLPTGRIDGIVPLKDGSILVASQDGHNVYHVPAGAGKPVVVAKDIAVPAAIGHDTKRSRLLIPQIQAGSLTIVELAR